MDLEKLSVAELDALKTETVQKANTLLATAREINVVSQSKLEDESAAEEAARIIASTSPAAREKLVSALIKGEAAAAGADGKVGGV